MKIFQRMKKNQRPSFEELLKDEQEKLYRVAYSFVKNEQDALDIVQDAVIKGYRNFEKLDEIHYFSTWLTRILINTAIDAVRKKREVVFLDPERTESNRTDESHIINKLLIDKEFDRLKAEQKSLIILRFYYGYSIKEISEILNKPEGTIKSRLSRTLEQMKQHLEKGGVLYGEVRTKY
ncbi:putative RNA polymerase [Bacillus sp. TS-2]|nr:putative RNA polymerase [Bacillus sp. TS-2]